MFQKDISFIEVPALISDKQALEMATIATEEAARPFKVFIDMFFWSSCNVFDLRGKPMNGKKFLLIAYFDRPELVKSL